VFKHVNAPTNKPQSSALPSQDRPTMFPFLWSILFQWGVVGAENKHLFVKIKRKTQWRFSLVALKLLFLKYQSHKKRRWIVFVVFTNKCLFSAPHSTCFCEDFFYKAN